MYPHTQLDPRSILRPVSGNLQELLGGSDCVSRIIGTGNARHVESNDLIADELVDKP